LQTNVFFSWQSDLGDGNTNSVRRALRDARSDLEKQEGAEELSIYLDEATRDEAGSPNIPATILAKVAGCDIFVADVSLVSSAGRRVPNPNVCFELGVAVSHLGWNRVILLFNTTSGELADLPFDFDRHRVSSFDPSSREKLTVLLKAALKVIIAKKPQRPRTGFDPKLEMRRRDVRTISDMLMYIHWPTIREHFQNAPKVVSKQALMLAEQLHGYMQASTFIIHDPELNKRAVRLAKNWAKSISHPARYEMLRGHSHYTFTYSDDSKQRLREETEWDTIEDQLKEMNEAANELARYLATEYLEIDLLEREEAAWKAYCGWAHPED
jgi:hypothetical protein